MENLNTDYLEILNEENNKNFNTALNLYENKYLHEDLIEMLKNGSIVEKQISALKLEKLTCSEDAHSLLSNLTGQDGKIREAVSFKIKEFCHNQDYQEYFYNRYCLDIFLDAIIDINGNICRNIISSIKMLKNYSQFKTYFCPKLIDMALKLTEKIDKFDIQDGKYKVNKEIFKLYWCLETIYILYDKVDICALVSVLCKTKRVRDYTIREKTAKILTRNFDNEELIKIREELRQDKNYYVRRF